MSHFFEAVDRVLKAEGGLLIDPGEGGGAANKGITLTTYRTYYNDQTLSIDDLRKLSEDEAKLIYRKLYWDKLELDRVSGKLAAILLLDQAVNRGISGCKKILREMLNKYYDSDLLEDSTTDKYIHAVNEIADREFFRRFIASIQLGYIEIAAAKPEKAKNLKGWMIRTHNLLKLLV